MDEVGDNYDPALFQGKLDEALDKLVAGLEQLVQAASGAGIPRRLLSRFHKIVLSDAKRIRTMANLQELRESVDLVVTSPPYPGVHVLYHRWQIASRRETAAPFWVAGEDDGHGPSHYTLGGRGRTFEEVYFTSLAAVLESVRWFLRPGGTLCILVGLPSYDTHLPLLLETARSAGFVSSGMPISEREVPNRRWYARQQASSGAARELLITLQRAE